MTAQQRLVGLGLCCLLLMSCTSEKMIQTRKPDPGARAGGTLSISIDEPRSIDPPAANVLDPAGSLVTETMCDRLIDLDPVTGEPRPAIAESWIVSGGGDRITIKLRKGVHFSNGKELFAEDVVYSLSRIADRDFASPSAAIMEPVAGYDQVHGNKEVNDDRFRHMLQGISVIDNYSFEIHLSDKRADFFRALSHVAASPVPKHDVMAHPEAFARNPICAGPYRLTKPWSPGQKEIDLERVDKYYGGDTAFTRGGAGYANRIVFKIDNTADGRVAAFDKHTVSAAAFPEDVGVARAHGPAIVTGSTPTIEYIGLPTRKPPFDDVSTRVALSEALDRNAIVREIYGGLRKPATEFLPPALGSFARTDPCGVKARPTANLAAARASLKRSGSAPSKMTFYFNNEFGHQRLAQAVAKQWTDGLGIPFKLAGLPWDQYATIATSESGFDGPFRMSWDPTYLAPDRYLAPLFASTSIGRDNFTRYTSGPFDRGLIKQARRAGNAGDLRDEYQALEDILCGEMPVIPLDYGVRVYAVEHARIASAINRWTSLATGDLLVRELYVH